MISLLLSVLDADWGYQAKQINNFPSSPELLDRNELEVKRIKLAMGNKWLGHKDNSPRRIA